MADEKKLQDLNFLHATTVTSGFTDENYYEYHRELARFNDSHGFTNVEYRTFRSPFVESCRDSACEHALQQNYDALMFVDADMVGYPPHAMVALVEDAYVKIPASDAVGAYCNLKNDPYLPTIDTGTGTWEPHLPGAGLLEVIRTGGAFLLIKTTALRKFGPPWFRTKIANKPFDALSGVDNYARCKLSGRNPFYHTPEWLSLKMAASEGGPGESGIGEDSGFCDRLRAAGGRIFVDTDIAVGHAGKEVIDWRRMKEAFEKREKVARQACGVLS